MRPVFPYMRVPRARMPLLSPFRKCVRLRRRGGPAIGKSPLLALLARRDDCDGVWRKEWASVPWLLRFLRGEGTAPCFGFTPRCAHYGNNETIFWTLVSTRSLGSRGGRECVRGQSRGLFSLTCEFRGRIVPLVLQNLFEVMRRTLSQHGPHCCSCRSPGRGFARSANLIFCRPRQPRGLLACWRAPGGLACAHVDDLPWHGPVSRAPGPLARGA